MKTYHSILLALFLCPLFLFGQPDPVFVPLRATFEKPTDLFFRPGAGQEVYVAEKDGLLFQYGLVSLRKGLFLDLTDRIDPEGDGGVLSAVFHPQADSNYVYVAYTAPLESPDAVSRAVVSRFEVLPTGTADPGSETVLIEANQPDWNHNFGELAFGPDGYLYISTGDGGGTDDPYGYSQSRRSLLGKLLRIDVNRTERGLPYAIPRSNPFYRMPDFREEIFALGLRDPWRFSFDRDNGDIWIGDRGEDFAEEINVLPATARPGVNFGWNCSVANKSFGDQRRKGCQFTQFASPRIQFPDDRFPRLSGGAVTGGYVYRGPEPELRGYYFYGDLYQRGLVLVNTRKQLAGDIQVIAETPILNLSTFGEAGDGSLYAADYNGTIYRIEQRRSTTSVNAAQTTRAAVYPNPNGGSFTVRVAGSGAGAANGRLLDAAGREVARWPALQLSSGRVELTASQVSPGMYTLLLRSRSGLAMSRLVIK
jgi:glucose/arabinose dehydrogenase